MQLQYKTYMLEHSPQFFILQWSEFSELFGWPILHTTAWERQLTILFFILAPMHLAASLQLSGPHPCLTWDGGEGRSRCLLSDWKGTARKPRYMPDTLHFPLSTEKGDSTFPWDHCTLARFVEHFQMFRAGYGKPDAHGSLRPSMSCRDATKFSSDLHPAKVNGGLSSPSAALLVTLWSYQLIANTHKACHLDLSIFKYLLSYILSIEELMRWRSYVHYMLKLCQLKYRDTLLLQI